jgi:hypothetical protein
MPVPSAFSYSIISDLYLFYSFFEKPQKIIDFTKLKDGTSIAQVSDTLEMHSFHTDDSECVVENWDENRTSRMAVKANAFSDEWSFMVVPSDRSNKWCKAVSWFDQGISSNRNRIAVIAAAGKSKPFVLYTNKGFLGIVPDNSKETIFVFERVSVIFSFETDFQRVSTAFDSEEAFVAKSLTR